MGGKEGAEERDREDGGRVGAQDKIGGEKGERKETLEKNPPCSEERHREEINNISLSFDANFLLQLFCHCSGFYSSAFVSAARCKKRNGRRGTKINVGRSGASPGSLSYLGSLPPSSAQK